MLRQMFANAPIEVLIGAFWFLRRLVTIKTMLAFLFAQFDSHGTVVRVQYR